jgi:carboxypeptidase D
VPALNYFNNVINLNESFIANITARADSCGYTDFFNKWTTEFPPSSKIPAAPSWKEPGCDIFDEVYNAVLQHIPLDRLLPISVELARFPIYGRRTK